jgi:signal transduction histidine kinase
VSRRTRSSIPHVRAERAVAIARVTLALASLAAIYLDPTEPTRFSRLTYSLLASYSVYSLVLLGFASSPVFHRRWRIATHLIDLGVFTSLVYLTEGPTSPFFAYYTFSLFCAALRFGPRGTLWTAAGAVAAYFVMGVVATELHPDAEIEANRFVIRSVYLAVVGALLVHLGLYIRRLQEEQAELASWPTRSGGDLEALQREIVTRAARLLHVPDVVFVWEQRDEPYLQVAACIQGEFVMEVHPPDVYEPVADPPFGDVSFICEGKRTVVVRGDEVEFVPGFPVNAGLRSRFALQSFVSSPCDGQLVEGRLFFAGRSGFTADDVDVAEVVAALASARLDEYHSYRRFEQAAADREKVGLARELHDGILQSFAGAALQLETLRRLVGGGGETERVLQAADELQKTLAEQEDEVQLLLEQLRYRGAGERRVRWLERLQALPGRVRRDWGVPVDLRLDADASRLQGRAGLQIARLLSEAVVNAARHAGGTQIAAELILRNGVAEMTIRDDGHGFPFSGRYDLKDLDREKRGPVTLKERVTALGGSMLIDSTEQGSTVQILLPVAGKTSG